ncbi:diheme cytochrome c [Allochromatium vinosum]|uniref:Diheme cytochrome c n=1 Tax=Allochromatium vinosum (strain ATCC 17899 / DSM 180 / NBRC 103801 / NCIMB 10441 / D) TaxID=572477 RepID=D3RUU3_ALLVD|nr:diheme cytochrome c [Allochromatium vinosum]ADC60992.1 Diheme cytochrome c [Allochromatium vinosum DSM 180]
MSHRPFIARSALMGLLLVATGTALAATDDETRDWRRWLRMFPNIAPATQPAYLQECGSCHLAYPPGVLPAASWSRILAPESLADHYGDDASLPDALVAELRGYLMANAADGSARVRERAFAVPGAARSDTGLPRITETPYFIRKHRRIPARLVTDNPEVSRFSQCNRCHIGADRGVFDERQIEIPGLGRWKD